MALTQHPTPVLECGAELEPLVLQVFDGIAPGDPQHQDGCPHCRAALERLHAVNGTIGEMAAEPAAAPPGLVRAVMGRLRRDQGTLLVGAHARGTLTVTESIVTLIAGHVALAVPDVRMATVQVVGSGPVGPLRLSARISVVYAPSLLDVADAVRQRIRAAVEQLAGVPVAAVDVLVDDIA